MDVAQHYKHQLGSKSHSTDTFQIIAEYSDSKVSQKLGRRHKLYFNQDFICNVEAVFQQSLSSVYVTPGAIFNRECSLLPIKKKKRTFMTV